MKCTPPVGALVADMSQSDRIGYVQAYMDPFVMLRPPGGGREWEVLPEDIRPATAEEREAASVLSTPLRRGRLA